MSDVSERVVTERRESRGLFVVAHAPPVRPTPHRRRPSSTVVFLGRLACLLSFDSGSISVLAREDPSCSVFWLTIDDAHDKVSAQVVPSQPGSSASNRAKIVRKAWRVFRRNGVFFS